MILGGHFDLEKKEKEKDDLEKIMSEPNFWDDINQANAISSKLNTIKKELTDINSIQEDLNLLIEYKNMYEELQDEEILNELQELSKKTEKSLDELEIKTLLSNEYDEMDCYLEIHPGAGGTESCDWANMLKRMYQRFCEKKNYKYSVLDEQKGDEAGIKSVTIEINGTYAYGYFKCEKGVHRLVRISPFDSNSRRHTSFASVSVTPKLDRDIDIEINEKDLKIDVYRSSGNGGQGVNTTDSAVRITHLPTKIVVTCQNERSQIMNKEHCMKMLKSKLYQLEEEKRQQEENQFNNNESINFGSQIRSYVLEPYTLVKDNRSKYETSQASKVLDGEIEELINSVLKMQVNK